MKTKQLLAILIIVLQVATLGAQEYHVFKNGDDSSSGSEGSPWKTIQHAMDNATPGSTVYIHEGIYQEALYLNVSGNDNEYIIFTAFEEDEVIIDAMGQTSTAVLEIYSVHHVSIEKLILRNHQRNDAIGILIEGASDHIRIKGCEIYDIHFSKDPNAIITEETNAHAIAVYGDDSDHVITDLEILSNTIHDCRLGFSEALVVNGNIDGFIISDNKVHDVTNIGIDIIGHEGTCDDPEKDQARNGIISKNVTFNCLSPYATSAGIYVDGGKNLIIERNRVHSNQWGIEIGCENIGKSTDNVIVRNNLIYNNSTSGLSIGGYNYPSGSGKVTNVSFVNNSLHGNDTEGDYLGEIYLSYTENLEIINNVISGTSPTNYLLSTEDLEPSIGLKIDHNNWTTSQGLGQEEFYFNGNSYEGITQFQDAVNGVSNTSFSSGFRSEIDPYDFRLTPNSDLIDIGILAMKAGEEDFSGNKRKVGLAIDLGAYESDPLLSTEDPFQENINVYPNPCNQYLMVHNSVNEEISIFDVYGNLSLKIDSTSKMELVDISELISGIYIITIGDDKREIVIKQ